MGYVALDLFKKYANKSDQDAAGEALYQMYLDSAESVVADYLSYSPVSQTYTHTLAGSGKTSLQLKAKPITALTSVTIDGASRLVSDFTIENEVITDKTGAIFAVSSTIVAVYVAGYTTVPGNIQHTVMRIASLMSMEAGENIGVTSSSFDAGNSRTFINYTNYAKYLAPLSSNRIIRL